MTRDMIKNLIIAFLLGMLVMDAAYALKIPNIQVPDTVEPEVADMLQNYVIPILNNGKYVCRVSPVEVLATDKLSEGEFLLETSGVTKRFVISDGTNNYYVNLTAV